MGNEKNLIPFNQRTENEQRKIASLGGKASGEARRAKKTLRECMELILSKPVTDSRRLKTLVSLDIDCDDMDNKMLIAAALFKRAASGDVMAIRELRNLIGEDKSQYNMELEDDPLTRSLKEEMNK